MSSSLKRHVAAAVAHACGVSASRLWTDRTHRVARARALGFYVFRYGYRMSINEIAGLTRYSEPAVRVAIEIITGSLIDCDEVTMERLRHVAAYLDIAEDALLPRRPRPQLRLAAAAV